MIIDQAKRGVVGVPSRDDRGAPAQRYAQALLDIMTLAVDGQGVGDISSLQAT